MNTIAERKLLVTRSEFHSGATKKFMDSVSMIAFVERRRDDRCIIGHKKVIAALNSLYPPTFYPRHGFI